MATINLGNIKFNWKGTYAGGTAYVVDDVVSYSGSSYICKLASTGNLPTNGTYWDVMSQKGTDGTDVGTTITTQGDLLYRDGSGLQRLAKGTGLQQLRMNSGATAPEWATISGGSHTKIAEFTSSGTPTDFVMDNIFTSTYDFYLIYITNLLHVGGTSQSYFRYRTGGASGSNDGSSKYIYMYNKIIRTSGAETDNNDGAWENSHGKFANYDLSADTNSPSMLKVYIQYPYSSSVKTSMMFEGGMNQSNMTGCSYTDGTCIFNANTSHTGLMLSAQDHSNGMANGIKAFVYGIKY